MTQPREPLTSNTAEPGPERFDAPRIRISVPHTGDAPETALVVGHGLDPASQEALRVAVDLTQRLRAHLHVVHAVDLGDYPIDPDAADWEEQAERALAKEHDQVRTALAAAPAGWTYHASRGDPVGLLAAVADEHSALMIIVGTRGEGFVPMIERMLGRSVSHGVIHRQHRPVLVVPSPR
jgi:nucleotide-binding universal stress UspA family protein